MFLREKTSYYSPFGPARDQGSKATSHTQNKIKRASSPWKSTNSTGPMLALVRYPSSWTDKKQHPTQQITYVCSNSKYSQLVAREGAVSCKSLAEEVLHVITPPAKVFLRCWRASLLKAAQWSMPRGRCDPPREGTASL